MVDLEALNFDLEEQLVRSDTPETGRKRAYTIMENSITEKDKVCVSVVYVCAYTVKH